MISGKEALIALANGEEVEVLESTYRCGVWLSLLDTHYNTEEILKEKTDNQQYALKFRLKPRTITLNGIEVPAPFEPKGGEDVWCISDGHGCGYCSYTWDKNHSVKIGAWRTEEEVKQVVEALRNVFNP